MWIFIFDCLQWKRNTTIARYNSLSWEKKSVCPMQVLQEKPEPERN